MPKLTTYGSPTREALMDREPFTTYGALSAVSGSVWSTGHLPQPWADQYRDNRDHITYTVMSYRTPIAWVLDNGTVVIPRELSGPHKGQLVKYSRTTSGHQGMLYALDTERLSFSARAAIRESAERERQAKRDRSSRVREEIVQRMNNQPARDREPHAGTYGFRSTAADYDALIAEVGELSRPVR